jgi:hypothetical protein
MTDELNNVEHGSIVLPWDSMGVNRLQQHDEDGIFEYTAIVINVPQGQIVLPITAHKQDLPPVALQVKLQTSARLMLEAIHEIQLWDQGLTGHSDA